MCVFVRRIRSYSERHVSCHWNLLYNQTCHIVGFLLNVFLVFFLFWFFFRFVCLFVVVFGFLSVFYFGFVFYVIYMNTQTVRIRSLLKLLLITDYRLVHLLALMLLDIIIYICTAEIRNVNILFANG